MAQCVAHSRRTGAPCRRAAINGGTVCSTHGGRAPQVRAKAAQRAELRELMDRPLSPADRRHPWEILLEGVQRYDVLVREGKFSSEAAQLEHLEKSIKLAKLAEDARIGEKIAFTRTEEIQRVTQKAIDAFVTVLDQVLDALPIASADRDPLRWWALECVRAGASDEPLPPRPVLMAAAAEPEHPAAPLRVPTGQRPARVRVVDQAGAEDTPQDHRAVEADAVEVQPEPQRPADPWLKYLREDKRGQQASWNDHVSALVEQYRAPMN